MILKENMFIEPKMKISGLISGQTTDFMFIERASDVRSHLISGVQPDIRSVAIDPHTINKIGRIMRPDLCIIPTNRIFRRLHL